MFSTLQLLFSKVHSSTAWLCTTFFPRCVLCCWFCLVGHRDLWDLTQLQALASSLSTLACSLLSINFLFLPLIFLVFFDRYMLLYQDIICHLDKREASHLRIRIRQGRVGKKICALDVHSDSKDKDATGLSKLPQFFIQRQASPKTVRFWSQLQCHMLDNVLWGKSFSLYT